MILKFICFEACRSIYNKKKLFIDLKYILFFSKKLLWTSPFDPAPLLNICQYFLPIKGFRAVKYGGGMGPPITGLSPPSRAVTPVPRDTFVPPEICFCALHAHFPVICSMNLPLGSRLARLVSTLLHFVAVYTNFNHV